MTMYGYKIRNEYGLGAAELYKNAYQEDPENILEGVAVAGLVGFLCQLGDLAEFAARIFHGLHEEITNTASRSQNIMLRVQQLEADLPMAEKDLFHHRYTDYALNEGTSWHPNLNTDSNIVTKEEMPPYAMEFYKQSRGPPQLFRLDKYDKAGAGACLKRHTDPSFFRVDLSTYGITTQGYPRETRTLKPMRELSSISTNIARSLKMPQIVPRKEMSTKDQDGDEIPIRRVKLKQKQFNSSLLSHMQNLLETDSPAHESFTTSISYTNTELKKPNESFASVEKNKTKALHKRLTSLGSLINHDQDREDTSLGSLINHNRNREDTSSSDEKDDSPSSEFLSNSSTTQQNQMVSPPDQDTESGENSDGYISDTSASEGEFLDALTTTIVDSEIETDSEDKGKNSPSLVDIGSRKSSSERKDVKESTLLRSKSSSVRDNGHETEQVPIKPVSGTDVATAPDSDGGVGKSMKETEPHYRTVSFNKLASKKVSYQENEYSPVTTNENEAKAVPKLQKDSFSHSLRHMAKQLLEFKHDSTEDEEDVYLQDLEENEDELLFETAGFQEFSVVKKAEYLMENVQNGGAIEISDLIAEDTETIETEIANHTGKDEANLTSHGNELHGLQNIESIEIEQLNACKEFGKHELHINSDVTRDAMNQDEISTDSTVTKNLAYKRVSYNKMSATENLQSIKMKKIDSGETMHADEINVGKNVEIRDETVMDSMVADNLARELHKNEKDETQNLTLIEEQELVESEGYLGSKSMQHGEETYEISGHGTLTKRSIKEEEQELVESEGYLGSKSMQHGGETYEISGRGTLTKRSIKEVFYKNLLDNQNLSSKEGEKLYKTEMHVGAHILQHEMNKSEKLITEEVFDSDVSESENQNSNEIAMYESEMCVGLDGVTAGTYELPVDDTETGHLVEPEDCDSGIAESEIVNSIEQEEKFLENENEEECLENEMGILSDGIQHACEVPKVGTVDENLVTEGAMPENLLQEQNAYIGDATQILASVYPLDDNRTLSDNSAEPWDSNIDAGLSVEALVDHYELLEEEKRDTQIQPASSRPVIKDTILLEAPQSTNEPLEEEDEVDQGGELQVVQEVVERTEAEAKSINPVPMDPINVLGAEIANVTETPAACNSEVTSVPDSQALELDTELQDEVETAVACNSEVISVPVDPVMDLDTEFQDEVGTAVVCNSKVISVPVDPVMDLDTEFQDDVGTAVACNSEVISVPVDPVMDLDTEIQDEEETPVACNSEVISVPVDPVVDLDTEFQDEVGTSVAWNSEVISVPVDSVMDLGTAIACNSEVTPDRVIISPPIQNIAPTHYAAPEEGDIIPAMPPLPPVQWRMGKPQMSPFPSLGPMAPPPHPSKFGILPSITKLGRPPRPKSSRVVALERKMHDVNNEWIEENCEIISSTKELQNCVMLASFEADRSMKGFASVTKNPICVETTLRDEDVSVRELSVKEKPLSTREDKFQQKFTEEPQKKPPSVPVPPKYPLFQVTPHDNSMMKKAPTLIQPASRLITPSMLEEIKNKSCNLKPVMVKRPNFMGPYNRTNLKVAAMLEKANAIRQAVGSDDSDNDSWSE